jgi:protein disulfide-isomerase A6
MLSSFLSVCCLLFLIPGSRSLYSANSKVKQLTSINFHNTVIKGKGVWFVEFYSPGCPHCRNLVPEYEKLASALDGIANIGAVDTQAENVNEKIRNIKILF